MTAEITISVKEKPVILQLYYFFWSSIISQDILQYFCVFECCQERIQFDRSKCNSFFSYTLTYKRSSSIYCLMDVNVPFRYYFLFDTLTVAMTNFVYTGRLRWLAAIQMCQHLFFVFTWNEHPYTNKVQISFIHTRRQIHL